MRVTVESTDVSPDLLLLLAGELEAQGVPTRLLASGVKNSFLDNRTAFASFDVSIANEETITLLSTLLAKASGSTPMKIKLNDVECPATDEEAISKAIRMSLYAYFDEVAPRELLLTEQQLLEIERNGYTLDSLFDSIDASCA